MKFAAYALSALTVASAIIAMFTSHSRVLGARETNDPRSSLAALQAAQPASRPTVNVKIDNFHFEPKELGIAVGTTVTWQNADDVPHTVTSKSDSQTLDSNAIDTDDKYSFTFTKPGKYPYYCKVHPHMTGVITVK
jgi:plastocyanin